MVESIAMHRWQFGSDIGERKFLFAPEAFLHPAKMHLGLLRRLLMTYTDVDDVLLDPMAGSGSLMLGAYLFRNVILRDLQPEYVDLMRLSEPVLRQQAGMLCGSIDIGQANAKSADYPKFKHIISSPPYGFETGKGITPERLERIRRAGWFHKTQGMSASAWTGGYKYAGGSENAGNKSGGSYWKEMRLVYANCVRQMDTGALMVLVIKDHFRRGKRICVVDQTITEVTALGLRLKDRHERHISNPSLWQRLRKESGAPVLEHEDVLVFEK